MQNKGKSPAHSSGMRGSEKPRVAEQEADDGKEELDAEGSDSELQDSEELGTTVAEHIHKDPETGHHHLNLTTLAGAMQKRGGAHDK